MHGGFDRLSSKTGNSKKNVKFEGNNRTPGVKKVTTPKEKAKAVSYVRQNCINKYMGASPLNEISEEDIESNLVSSDYSHLIPDSIDSYHDDDSNLSFDMSKPLTFDQVERIRVEQRKIDTRHKHKTFVNEVLTK